MYAHKLAAAAYDLVHDARGKDYYAEARQIAEEVRQRRPQARRLLDVACGTGRHPVAFRDLGFEVSGVELSAAMLETARSRLAGVELCQGDMRSFVLPGRFDAVVCLFSAIGYMTTEADLEQAIATMAAHLVPGGLVVVEPWFGPDDWAPGTLQADCAMNEHLAVARVSRSGREDATSTIEIRYVVATEERIETFDEHHRMGLFSPAQYRRAFERAGLTVDHDLRGLTGRGLFVGTTDAR